ncbi:kinase-like domain-containing protein [Rhizoctonia solani]|nr:kinase-like domain-containing protein [Rhizoctonia solani]
MEQVIALLDYNATEPGELSFKKGESLTVLDRKYEHWWLCKSANSMFGVVPCNHVKPSNYSRTRFVSIESAKRPVIRRQSTPISRNMAAKEVVSQLVTHGCQDLTGRLAISSFSEYPAFHGGFSDIYQDLLLNGTQVAVKALRVSVESISQDLKHLKHAARELHTWSRCRHPNVIPLLGLAIFRDRIGMVSPWMAYGNLPRYLTSEPGVNRLNMCIQICEGLSYLHEIQITHCDLKGANVLVSNEGVPILTDFGNSSLTDRTLGFTETTSSPSFTVRWSAAEIIEEKTSHTEASDVYALGMTIYETMTGQVPYQGKSESNVILLMTVKKELPDRPEVGISDELWGLLAVCYSFEPAARPSAAEVVEAMRAISVNQEHAKVRYREITEHQERKRAYEPEMQENEGLEPPNKGSQPTKEKMPSETNVTVEDDLFDATVSVIDIEYGGEKKLPEQAELQARVELRVIEEQPARERGHVGEARRLRKKQRAEEAGRREAGGHREREKQKTRRVQVPVLVTLAHSPTRNLSVLDAWNSYEESWSALSTASSNQSIGFYDIPWPLFRVPTGPESITTQAVGEFILFPYHSRDKSRKERLRNAVLRWQLDKFEGKLMSRIKEADRSKVRKAVAAFIHSLTELTIKSAVSTVGSKSLTTCGPTPGNVYH